MKRLIAIITCFMLSYNSLASTGVAHVEFDSFFKKYEYLLTAHPSAHEEGFRTNTLKEFEKELKSLTSKADQKTLENAIKSLIQKVPSEDKRQEYLDLLNSNDIDSLDKLISDRELLSRALQQDSSNFSSRHDHFHNIILGTIVVGAIIALIYEVSQSIKYEKFKSLSVETDWGGTNFYCSSKSASYLLRNKLKREAEQKCLDHATYPETCRFDRFNVTEYENYDYWGNSYSSDCFVQAVFKADRSID